MLEHVITAVVTGIVSSVLSVLGTVAALKVEIKWLTAGVNRAHERIDQLETRI
jgi:uncharacterized membrane protein required for colicin V production